MDVETLERNLRGDLAGLRVPGLSIAVVKQGRLCWAQGFGFADLATGSRATAETAYMWFSMTKTVTATAIMQLVDEGRIGLGDPVAEYIPDFPKPRDPAAVATVRHLLNHSSGLPNPIPIRWVHAADAPEPDPERFLRFLLKKVARLRSRPGETTRYSNLGYVALGSIVGTASGRTYKDYVRERILRPLGMSRTDFGYRPEMGNDSATGYQRRRSAMGVLLPLLRLPRGTVGGTTQGYRAFNRFYVDGASYGGLIGPVRDAARIVQLHLGRGQVDGRRLLSPASVALMQQISARNRRLDIGLGWFTHHQDESKAPTYLEQVGGGVGFLGDMRIFPRESLGIVVMGNSTRYNLEHVINVAKMVDWTSEPNPEAYAWGSGLSRSGVESSASSPP